MDTNMNTIAATIAGHPNINEAAEAAVRKMTPGRAGWVARRTARLIRATREAERELAVARRRDKFVAAAMTPAQWSPPESMPKGKLAEGPSDVERTLAPVRVRVYRDNHNKLIWNSLTSRASLDWRGSNVQVRRKVGDSNGVYMSPIDPDAPASASTECWMWNEATARVYTWVPGEGWAVN